MCSSVMTDIISTHNLSGAEILVPCSYTSVNVISVTEIIDKIQRHCFRKFLSARFNYCLIRNMNIFNISSKLNSCLTLKICVNFNSYSSKYTEFIFWNLMKNVLLPLTLRKSPMESTYRSSLNCASPFTSRSSRQWFNSWDYDRRKKLVYCVLPL